MAKFGIVLHRIRPLNIQNSARLISVQAQLIREGGTALRQALLPEKVGAAEKSAKPT